MMLEALGLSGSEAACCVLATVAVVAGAGCVILRGALADARRELEDAERELDLAFRLGRPQTELDLVSTSDLFNAAAERADVACCIMATDVGKTIKVGFLTKHKTELEEDEVWPCFRQFLLYAISQRDSMERQSGNGKS